MLKVLEDKSEIKKAQALFMEKLTIKADRTEELIVGYPGGSDRGNVSWSSELEIWWIHKSVNNRFWNGFGTEQLQWDSKHSHTLDCEINPPFAGINRQIAGAFAKDENEELFLLHRGLIGGGRPGIGKGLFIRQYIGPWEIVQDGSSLSRLALVAAFEDPNFVDQIAWFVNEVKRVKSTVDNAAEKSEVSSTINVAPIFNDEFSGTRNFNVVSKQIAQKCNHGLIVKALARKFKAENVEIGNSRIDLYTFDSKGHLKTLFEIKTDTTSNDVYKAIGQLFYYSTSVNQVCSLVAVFPKSLKKEPRKILNKLSIDYLLYEWSNGKPQFIDCDIDNYV